ncbi:MAG: MarR family winged helix-turn-helix transcriptional regulator [Candidatus Nitrospinota bacterium M3_3B_026]
MGTHYEGTKKEKRALDLFIKLARASESVMAGPGAAARAAGLSPSQFGALETLYHLGPMCQRELGRKMLKSGGNITTVVDNLERHGLARRERDAEDRRYITVRLTPKGERLIVRVFPKVLAEIVEETAALTPAEQEEASRLLRKLGHGAARRRGSGGFHRG